MDYKRVTKEPLKKDWLAMAKEIDNSDFDAAMEYSIGVVRDNLGAFTEKFPSSGGVNNEYIQTNNADHVLSSDWTSSFWTGMVWISYALTGEDCFKNTGLIHSKSFRERYENNDILDHHDIGFLYSLSCVAANKLTGDEYSKETALLAARKLLSRFREVGGFIQQGGLMDDVADKRTGIFIVDCCMNLPLLYWAANATGDEKFYNAAYAHIQHAGEYLVRNDGGTHQDALVDINTGKWVKSWTAQGVEGNDKACWARGQAWSIYGFALSYSYTQDASLLEIAKRTANYFLNRLQDDNCANWDFLYQNDDAQRDTSAVSTAACGLLEIARYLPLTDPDREVYEAAAKVLIDSLTKNYLYNKNESSNALLKAGVYAYHTGLCVNEPTIWGDYFYMECLYRLTKIAVRFW